MTPRQTDLNDLPKLAGMLVIPHSWTRDRQHRCSIFEPCQSLRDLGWRRGYRATAAMVWHAVCYRHMRRMELAQCETQQSGWARPNVRRLYACRNWMNASEVRGWFNASNVSRPCSAQENTGFRSSLQNFSLINSQATYDKKLNNVLAKCNRDAWTRSRECFAKFIIILSTLLMLDIAFRSATVDMENFSM